MPIANPSDTLTSTGAQSAGRATGTARILAARRIERIDRDLQVMREFELAARIARALAHDHRDDI
jgi:hypothetical protein